MHKNMGGEKSRTAEPNYPKGCSIPYEVLLSTKGIRKAEGKGTFVLIASVFLSNHYSC